MLKPEMALPVKALLWLLAISAGYAFAAFLAPEETVTSTGLVGYNREVLPLFNWKLFLYVTGASLSTVPLVSMISRTRLIALAELLFIGGIIFLATQIVETLQGEEELQGLQGWKEKVTSFLGSEKQMRRYFDTGPFLLVFTGAFCLWAFGLRLLNLVHEKSLNTPRGVLQLVLLLAAIVALVLFTIGLHQPVFHSTKFWIMEEDVSLSGSVYVFWRAGENFIATLVLLFTFVFPVVKFAAIFWALMAPEEKAAIKVNSALAWLGKWSMLDVFVLALILVNMKLDSGLLDMELRGGMVYFSVSVLLTMLCSAALSLMKKKMN